MEEIKISQDQKRILDGYVCPKCKVDTARSDTSVVTNGSNALMWSCPSCGTHAPAYTKGDRVGEPSGKMMTKKEREVLIMVYKEVTVLCDKMSDEEIGAFVDDIKEMTGIPYEYLELSRMSMISLWKVMVCLSVTKAGGKIVSVFDMEKNPTLKCPMHKNFLIGSSPCGGCPDSIINIKGKVACARNISYGVLKDRDMEEKYRSSINTVLNQ